MKVESLHSWQVNPAQTLAIQQGLAAQVSRKSEVATPRFIAGVDISTGKGEGMATAAVVVLQYPELSLVETKIARGRLYFPYIPGLLSFRESPLTLAACSKLTITPDLILVDGQGIAHPRRLGLASHLGLWLDTPTIGCAKSPLCGTHQAPGIEPASYTEVTDKGEIIGVALRSKRRVKPVYVSIGHKVDLNTAIYWVLNCCRGYRLPEPTRLAHLAAGANREPERAAMVTKADERERLLG